MGQREEALAAIGEAIEIHRRLASIEPGAFAADLARSQGTLGDVLSALGQPVEATDAFAGGLRTLLPLAARYPGALADLGRLLFSDYQRAVSEASIDADPELLSAATRILGPHPDADRGAAALSPSGSC